MIKDYTTEQLKQELQKRERKGLSYTPPIIESPDDTSLKAVAKLYLEDTKRGAEIDAQYAYGCLMETYYGEGFFDWVNSLPEDR